jgi:predicted MFS family arabinose efflux permease
VTDLTPLRRFVFVALLFGAMGAATLAPAAIGILATFLIDDLSMSRATLGWVVSTNVLIAAALSPVAGVLTDRFGGKASMIAVFASSGVAFALFGVAWAVAILFVGSMVSAFSQAGGNPATNTLIGDVLEPGERGIVTGIKQSGVQAAIAVAGLTLPSLAIAFGWRIAMLIVAVGPALAALVAWWMIPSTSHHRARRQTGSGPLPHSIRWLAAYGGVFGFAGAVTFFVPLFAEESLGFDPRVAGAAATAAGVVAFGARIVWARYAEVRRDYAGPLTTMAVLGMVAAVMFALAPTASWTLWVAVALTGASTSAWNSVGMLAVIDEPDASTGRASGVVLLGFLAGLGLGPPVYGLIVDETGSYALVWVLSLAAAAAALLIALRWRRLLQRARRGRAPRRSEPPATS